MQLLLVQTTPPDSASQPLLESTSQASAPEWTKITPEGVNLKFFYGYANPNQDALIKQIALNLLPFNCIKGPLAAEKFVSKKSFYVCVIVKAEKVSEIQAIFKKHNETDDIKSDKYGRNQQEFVFLVWSDPASALISQSIQNFLNTVCNPEILAKDCVSKEVKKELEEQIQKFLNPPAEKPAEEFAEELLEEFLEEE